MSLSTAVAFFVQVTVSHFVCPSKNLDNLNQLLFVLADITNDCALDLFKIADDVSYRVL